MEYDFKSMAQPILTVEEFKELQKIKGIELSQTELFLTYNKYVTHAKEYNKSYGDIENV
mgnify:CR=1 FL=1